MATVSCPSCGRALEVDSEYRDWTVRCPHCDHEFVPSEVASAGLTMESAPEPRRSRRSDEDDAYERPSRRRDGYDDDDYDRPRRRRRRDDDDDGDYYTQRDAANMVAAPALWLAICGWVGAILTVGICIVLMAMGTEQMNNPQRNRGPDDDPGEMLVFMGCCLGILGVPYSVAMGIGAQKMRNLSSRGWAM